MKLHTNSRSGFARFFGVFFLLSVLSPLALFAQGFAPDDILSARISIEVTEATYREDLGAVTRTYTASDLSSNAYQYTKTGPNTARVVYERVVYDDGEYDGTLLMTFNSADSGTFRDEFTGEYAGFTSGSFQMVEWEPVFAGTTWFSGAAATADGWRYFDWFKGFKPQGANWIYHGRHGWLYVVGENTQGMFLWDVALGRWMYTNATVYPWMYAYGSGEGWVFFFEGGQPGSRYFKRGDTGALVSEGDLSL